MVRGLRLFVRPIEATDHSALQAFFSKQGNAEDPRDTTPAWGLLGKLLGDVVAVFSLDITDDALRVEDLTVARDLRRKWIGRVMMRSPPHRRRTCRRRAGVLSARRIPE
jgi:hypothetical protein